MVTVLTNGTVVLENSILEDGAVLINGTRIEYIGPSSSIKVHENMKIYNCMGNFILPGLIDIHSDAIENVIVPRKGIIFNVDFAIHEIDRQLASQGITTTYHSISIANSTICNRKRTLNIKKLLNIEKYINKYPENQLLINHKFHARLEITSVNICNDLIKLLEKGKIHEISIMDHTPGQGQYSNLEIFKKEITKQYGYLSDKKKDLIVKQCQHKKKINQKILKNILMLAHRMNIPTAFHDVHSEKQLQWMQMHHIKICEFPLNLKIASYASSRGYSCVVGAPNVLQGKSHNHNASAIDLLIYKHANILCSDYLPA